MLRDQISSGVLEELFMDLDFESGQHKKIGTGTYVYWTH